MKTILHRVRATLLCILLCALLPNVGANAQTPEYRLAPV